MSPSRTLRSVCAAILAAGLLATTSRGVRAEGSAPPDARNAVYTLVLEKALPGERPLNIYLQCQDGRFVAAVCKAPGFCTVSHDADISKLSLDGAAVKGEVAVTVYSDGYNPVGRTKLACVYKIEAKVEGMSVTGTFDGRYDTALPGGAQDPKAKEQVFKGAVSGALAATPALTGLRKLDIHMENAVGDKPHTGGSFGTRGVMSIIFQDGKPVHTLVQGHGGNQITYFEAVATEVGLKWDGNSFGGLVKVTAGKDKYEYTFEGQGVGNHVGGSFRKKLNDKDAPGHRFNGKWDSWTVIPANEAIYWLELHGAIPETKFITMYLRCAKGAFPAAVGYAGTFNHTYHDVDSAGLTLEGDTVKGSIKVTLNPDPYIPPDKKPVACSYTLEAQVQDGCVRGTFTGLYKEQKVKGDLLGRLRPVPPLPDPLRVYVKLDNGVCGGAPWFRRAYIGFIVKDGKAEQGGISNNKGGYKGTFKGGTVDFDGANFKATLQATVDETNGPLKGNYTFILTGKAVGGELIGKADTLLEGELKKQGTDFMGGFGAGE